MDTAEPGERAESSTRWVPPAAAQPQIIRAHQRDIYFLAAFMEQCETVLRSFFGVRTLRRWEKEINLLVRAFYLSLTLGRGFQTLGEEYTDVYQVSARSGRFPTHRLRIISVLLSTLPFYLVARLSASLNPQRNPALSSLLALSQTATAVAADVNLALFYFQGRYYSLLNRFLSLRPHTMSPPEPGIRPPSYGLLGLLLSMRLAYRAYTFISSLTHASSASTAISTDSKSKSPGNATFIDAKPVTLLLHPRDPEDKGPEHAYVSLSSLTPEQHSARRCVLCLEERTATAATACGHLFCWTCVVDWTREKPECPLCRQKIDLQSLLAIYNL
ncbi:peroxisome assembly protein per8 [Dacryopinax primogenitus]|uniref:RING-type E3 ubiquitin transferase n=1 Tax=Dacryopinax primogenitus (strain DJM 731) TaxID=1858805 RepID=M5G532_DACPD|nr:peroxisome assembly protein per8 [Dacryopinax primogenitus]EJU05371.1 peroxisome assembly protein per8 [Dacryopinax primogenitus]